jgi:hypothetical protein
MRYFFDLRRGDTVVADEVGTLCADDLGACCEAALIAADFVGHCSENANPKWRDWQMEVRDQHGRSVLCRALRAMAGAATTPAGQRQRDQWRSGQQSGSVVDLAAARHLRRLRALANARSALLLRASEMNGRRCYLANRLYSEIRAARRIIGATHTLIARSQDQSRIDPWATIQMDWPAGSDLNTESVRHVGNG